MTFNICEKETDILVSAGRNLEKKTASAVVHYRRQIENYIRQSREFKTSLCPIDVDDDADPIVRDMIRQSKKAGVGPMASVAGAIAEYVGMELFPESSEVIVENGGDIFLRVLRKRIVAVYAGDSIFTGRLALEIDSDETPLGICTSSGTVGRSLSFGKADAVVIFSSSAILADAAATAVCNLVRSRTDIEKALSFARSIDGVKGVVVIIGDKLGCWGCVKLITN